MTPAGIATAFRAATATRAAAGHQRSGKSNDHGGNGDGQGLAFHDYDYHNDGDDHDTFGRNVNQEEDGGDGGGASLIVDFPSVPRRLHSRKISGDSGGHSSNRGRYGRNRSCGGGAVDRDGGQVSGDDHNRGEERKSTSGRGGQSCRGFGDRERSKGGKDGRSWDSADVDYFKKERGSAVSAGTESTAGLTLVDTTIAATADAVSASSVASMPSRSSRGSSSRPRKAAAYQGTRKNEEPITKIKKPNLVQKGTSNKRAFANNSKNNVTFSPTAKLHQWYRHGSCGDDNNYSSWYNKKEYKVFRRQTKYEVAKVRHRAERKERRGNGKSHQHINDAKLGEVVNDSEISESGDDWGEEDDEEEQLLTGIEHLICEQTLTKIMQLRELHKVAILEEYERLSHVTKMNYYRSCHRELDGMGGDVNTMAPSAAADPVCQQALRAMSKRYSKYSKVRAWRYAGNKELPPPRRRANREQTVENDDRKVAAVASAASRKIANEEEYSTEINDHVVENCNDSMEEEATRVVADAEETLQAVAIAASIKNLNLEDDEEDAHYSSNVNKVASLYNHCRGIEDNKDVDEKKSRRMRRTGTTPPAA